VLLGKGDVAYVRGDINGVREWRVFQYPKELRDPDTNELLGYEGTYVATADYEREGGTNDAGEIVPATFRITSTKLEANIFNRLLPAQPKDYAPYVPRPPSSPISGRIVSVYGEALNAGQNQIVALNKGARDGVERGHVLALWRAGQQARDLTTDGPPQALRLPYSQQNLAALSGAEAKPEPMKPPPSVAAVPPTPPVAATPERDPEAIDFGWPGRLRISGRSFVGCRMSITASQVSRLKSSSAVEKVSGEYSKYQSVFGCFAASSRSSLAALTAICFTSSRVMRNTISRQAGLSAL